MSLEGIQPVSSKEHMLKPTDIFLVAAHEYKDGLELVSSVSKKHGLSPERMSYSIMIKEYSDPRLVRIRVGNTLFTIAALPEGIGFARSYNGDTAENYISNMLEFLDCAKKMGFDCLFCHTNTTVVRAFKVGLRKLKNTEIKSHFDSSNNIFAISTGRKRNQ